MPTVFQREFSGNIAAGGSAALAHNITTRGQITPLVASGDTAVQDGFEVLVDVLKTDSVTVTLSARIGQVFVSELTGDELGLEGPGSLTGFGAAFKLSLSDNLSIMPEFHVVLTEDSAPVIYTLSLGFLF